jgi:hypothetical protein
MRASPVIACTLNNCFSSAPSHPQTLPTADVFGQANNDAMQSGLENRSHAANRIAAPTAHTNTSPIVALSIRLLARFVRKTIATLNTRPVTWPILLVLAALVTS